MKKLIIILLFSAGMQAQVKSPYFIQKTIITGTVEIDGHETKEKFILETTLSGVKIYSKENDIIYKLRKCDKSKCDIIHLEPKLDYTFNGAIKLSSWPLNNITPTSTH
jgi:hypothetical protein